MNNEQKARIDTGLDILMRDMGFVWDTDGQCYYVPEAREQALAAWDDDGWQGWPSEEEEAQSRQAVLDFETQTEAYENLNARLRELGTEAHENSSSTTPSIMDITRKMF